MISNKLALAGVVLAGLAAPALAHHSNAMFDYAQTVSVTGEVSQFLWTNPHSYLEMNVTNSQGNVQAWTIEFQGIGLNSERGLKIDSFKPGDTVTVTLHPLRNGTTGGDFYSATLADGTEITPPEDA